MRNGIIWLFLLMLFSFRCSTSIVNGGGETTNGVISGTIVNKNGLLASNTIITVIKSDYDPVKNNKITNMFIDTTDVLGTYSIHNVPYGIYTIEAVHNSKRTRLLITDVKVYEDTVIVAPDTLAIPGFIKVFIPDTVDTANAYLFIKGTMMYKHLWEAVSDSNEYSIVIDSVPASTVPGIYYQIVNNPAVPRLITDSMTVLSNDTAESNAFIFWVNYTTANSPLPDNRIQDLFIDNDGSFWFSTFNGGVAHYKGSVWSVYNTANSILPRNIVSKVFRDNDGSLWIVTQGGIAIVKGTSWSVITTSNSTIPSNGLTDCKQDLNGNKWFSSFDGILKYDGSQWTLYDSVNSALPSNEWVHVAVDSSNNIWCCGLYGVSRFNGTTWNTYTTSNSGIYTDYAYVIFVDSKKTIWFGHEGAVSRFDGTNWTIFNKDSSSFLQYRSFEFFEDNDGSIWIGTNSGLTKYSGSQFYNYTGKRYGVLQNKCFYALKRDPKDNMWVGTADIGVVGFGPTLK